MTQEIKYQDKPWLTSYEQNVAGNLEFEEAFLPDFLERSAEKFPDNMALLFQGYKVTYRELKNMVDCFATAMYQNRKHASSFHEN